MGVKRNRTPKPGNCQNCGASSTDLVFGKYCKPCRRFETKHGRLPERHERVFRVRGWVPCKNCKRHRTHIKGRCIACHSYWLRNGTERPKYREADTCVNCAVPLDRSMGTTRNYGGRGLCSACHSYEWLYKVPRPARLWSRGKYGYCDCGKPATHVAAIQIHKHFEDMPLCDECHAEYMRQVRWYGGEQHAQQQRTAGDD